MATPSYLTHTDRFYPVILGLPGVPGTINAYKDNLRIGQTINAASQNHKIREAIVVIAETFPNNLDTECVNSADGSNQIDTFVSTDVTYWIKSNLRAVNNREAWTTLGYSAGG